MPGACGRLRRGRKYQSGATCPGGPKGWSRPRTWCKSGYDLASRQAAMGIGDWLRGIGLEQYEATFREHEIVLEVLSELAECDLQSLGIPLGHRKLLLKAIRALAAETQVGEPSSPLVSAPALETVHLAERRQVTVVFCDLVGSTALSARLDPEDLREVIVAYQQCASQPIQQYGGFVAQYLGDGVLAYFGYPSAHEDDAERAVRAGLDLVVATRELKTRFDGNLRVRIGIATGLVVVGDLIGEGASRQEAVVGETPNLAARLQALAEPGTVVIPDSTRRLLGNLFKLRDLGRHELKGLREAVKVWAVDGISVSETRFEQVRAAQLTGFVGREAELGLLMDRWNLAKGGERQVVLLSGEPGFGKSRILRELRSRLEQEYAGTLSLQCSPYYSNSAFYPFVHHFERVLSFGRDEPPEAKLDKIQALVARDAGRPPEDVPFIASVLAVPYEARHGPNTMTPQKFRDETLRVLVDIIEAAARHQPTAMMFEDAHWADPTTLQAIDLLIGRASEIPLLIVLTHRPEFKSRWSQYGHVTSLTLNKLTRAQSAAMVSKLASGKALPPDLVEEMLIKTDGVPLFIEELTKSVLESTALRDAGDCYDYSDDVRTIAIPLTLRDSLTARLDRIGRPAKDVAQRGAVIGRDFSYELLASIADQPEPQLHEALDQLASSGLLFAHGTPPDSTYVFKHALVQDTAYRTLLRSRRQQLHMRIAKALVEGYPGTVEQQPQLLLHHATLAENHELAVRACIAAGQRSLRLSAGEEALFLAQRGLTHLTRVPNAEGQVRDLIALLKLKAFAIITRSGAHQLPELVNELQGAADDAMRRGFHADAGHALETIGWILQRANDDEQASRAALKAEEASRASDDLNRCHQLSNTGRCLLEVEREIPRALILIREAESIAARLHLEIVELEWAHAHVSRWSGELASAREHITHAVRIAKLRGEPWREIDCLIWSAKISLELKELDSVFGSCKAIDEISVRLEKTPSPVANALRTLAQMSSDPKRAASLEESLSSLRDLDDKANIAYVLNFGALHELMRERHIAAQAFAAEALAAARAVRRTTEIVVASTTLGRALSAQGDRLAGIACLRQLASDCNFAVMSARARVAVENASNELGISVARPGETDGGDERATSVTHIWQIEEERYGLSLG
jgi:class 3 adenylate cyclase